MQQTKEKLIKAPRVNLKREKFIWTAEAAIKYERIIAPHLRRLRENWLCPSSQSSMSILLETTNILLQKTASSTNKSKSLGNKPVAKSTKTPKPILKAQKQLSKFGKFCMKGKEAELRSAKANYRRTVRRTGVKNYCEHDMKLDQIMGDNPDSAYSFISYCRRTAQVSLDKLTVGDKVYDGADVPDGFYDSMSSIKSCNIDSLKSDPVLAEQLSNYEHISKLCQNKQTIPPISMDQSAAILKKVKQNVRDIFNITALHYLKAGSEGLVHYNFLLNAIIADVNNASLDELNLALGLILYKGHRKDKNSDRS